MTRIKYDELHQWVRRLQVQASDLHNTATQLRELLDHAKKTNADPQLAELETELTNLE